MTPAFVQPQAKTQLFSSLSTCAPMQYQKQATKWPRAKKKRSVVAMREKTLIR